MRLPLIYTDSMMPNGFLKQIEVSEDAFLVFNFAPPVLRRNIAILGLLHKHVLKQCHPAFSELLPWYFDEDDELHGNKKNNKQLWAHENEVIFQRALF